jgi:hypothetical protein
MLGFVLEPPGLHAGRSALYGYRWAEAAAGITMRLYPVAMTAFDSAVADAVMSPYAFANLDTCRVRGETHVPVGTWRSVSAPQIVLAIVSFIDEVTITIASTRSRCAANCSPARGQRPTSWPRSAAGGAPLVIERICSVAILG